MINLLILIQNCLEIFIKKHIFKSDKIKKTFQELIIV